MADALHIDRDRLILSPPDRTVPQRFWEMVERRKAGEPVAYITGRRAFWNIELHVGPGVLVPRPDSEVLIASAIEHFEGTRRSEADPRPRHRAGNAAARRARRVARGDGARRRCLAAGAVLRRRQRPAARLRGRLKLVQGNWADGLVETLRPHPVQPALCRRRRRAWPGRRANIEPDEALFAGERGARRLSRARAAAAAAARTPAGSRRSRSAPIRPKPSPRCSPATGFRRGSRTISPDRPRALLLTWG